MMKWLFQNPTPEHQYFVIDGEIYDFKDWIPKHPGGARWFSRANGRDITAAVYGYHANPHVTLKHLLRKYKVRREDVCKDVGESVYPRMNVPDFVLPPEFDATKGHVPQYDFHRENDFMARLRKRLLAPEMKRRIRQADTHFDLVTLGVFLFHLFLCFPQLHYGILPIPSALLVLLMAGCRTAMAGAGHYHCHRSKDGFRDWADPLFDIQYVGAHVVTYDGHALMHHLYTNSPADVKRTVFTGMLGIPRLFRIPVYTVHRFGNFLSGMLFRWWKFNKEPELENTEQPLVKHAQFFCVRFLMLAEFLWALRCGAGAVWFAQFFVTLWWNQFLIVSSHDFEELQSKADLTPGQDWGVFQVRNSFDMSVTGNAWVDTFLTAGLGCHRVHHVVPYQGSGFANIVSMPAVREVSKEMGVPWMPARNFVTECLPVMFRDYILSPAQFPGIERRVYGGAGLQGFIKEHLDPEGWAWMWDMVYTGFVGEGSI